MLEKNEENEAADKTVKEIMVEIERGIIGGAAFGVIAAVLQIGRIEYSILEGLIVGSFIGAIFGFISGISNLYGIWRRSEYRRRSLAID